MMDNDNRETITLDDGTTHYLDEEIPVPEDSAQAAEEANEEIPEVEFDYDDGDMEDIFSEEMDFDVSNGETEPEEEAPQKVIDERLEKVKEIVLSDDFMLNGIRIALGLIFLTFSAMSFMPVAASLILGLIAVGLCGLPVFMTAYQKVLDKKYLSEELIISVAAILSVIVGYAADGVFAVIIADLGFILRDNLFGRLRDEASDANDGATSEGDRLLLNRYTALVNTLYTPVVLILAVIVLILSIIFAGDAAANWIHRALVLVVAAAPCALAAVTALTYDFGKAAARERGVEFTDVKSVNNSAHLTSVIFNKTGTVTEGSYKVSGVYPVKISDAQLLYLAAYAEAFSEHPLAKTIREYAGVTVDTGRISRHREERGVGSIVQFNSNEIISAGSLELMDKLGIKGDIIPGLGVSVYIAVGKTFVGRIDFEDSIKAGARETVSQLRKLGVANVALITGDNSISATNIGREVGISEVYADCLPKDKYERVQYIAKSQEKDDKLAFVVGADSDVPAIRLADVGIVLGEWSANANAKVSVPSGEITRLPAVIRTSRQTWTAALVDAVILFAVKLLCIILGLIGILPMACALILDGVALICAALIGKAMTKK